MRVVVYPADDYGCGRYRLAWPAEVLARQGHDVVVVSTEDRKLKFSVRGEEVTDVQLPPGTDVLVLQRVTHAWVAQAIPLLRQRGVAVVIDVDDDLGAVHPSNPAWEYVTPRSQGRAYDDGRVHRHSWLNLQAACRDATLVTVSTPTLRARYAHHGRGRVLYNHLPASYLETPHVDSPLVGWPASLATHPDDPSVMGPAVNRLAQEGVRFVVVGDPTGCGRAFGLATDPPGTGNVSLEDWPAAVAQLGVGVAPLALSKFNNSKSWLKPLELAGVGVPWVGSPGPEYTRLHRLGCGLLADSPKRWYGTLRALVRDQARRDELSAAGRRVASELTLEGHAWLWLEAWDMALQLQRHTGASVAS